MSYSVGILPDRPILVIEMHQDFEYSEEGKSMFAEAESLLNQQTSPCGLLLHMGDIKFDFEDVISGINAAARGSDALFHHDHIGNIVFVTNNRLIKIAVKGLNTPVFGNLSITIANTYDEALDLLG